MLVRWIMVFSIALASAAAVQDTPALKTQKEKISYALGMDLGSQLRRSSIDVDPVLFGQGLKDALSGGKTLLTEEQVRAVISGLQAEQKGKEADIGNGPGENGAELEMLGAYNAKVGDAFLSANRKKEGWSRYPADYSTRFSRRATGRSPGSTRR